MSVWLATVCSEREADGRWEDCTWASGVMLANEAYGDIVHPHTQAEYEALRDASGDVPTPDSPGSGIKDLLKGFAERYGWIPRRLYGFAPVADSPVGTALVIAGLYAKLPARLRWTNFTGAHAFAIVKIAEGPAGWWVLDPLAPQGYAGEAATEAELRAFYQGISGAWAVAVTVGERSSMNPDTLQPVAVCDVTGTGPVYAAPTGTAVLTSSGGSAFSSFGPATGIRLYAMPVSPGSRAAVLIDRMSGSGTAFAIGYIDGSRITKIRIPGVDCTAAVKTATDPLNAKIAGMKSKTAAFAADIAND